MSGGADSRSRERRIARLRTRVAAIVPEDGDMIQVKSILKGLLDIISDDVDPAPIEVVDRRGMKAYLP